jgi:plastocyanin
MPHRSRRPLATRSAALAVTLLLAVAAGGVVVGSAGATTSTAPRSTAPTSTAPITKVTIKGYKFVPNKFTVNAGTRITVKNKDGAIHDLAAVNGKFKTKKIDGGKSAKFTVNKPGTYKIVCTLHPYMTGVLKAV